MKDCLKNRFLKDVKDHELRLISEDGLYRRLRFKRPDSNCMHFDLVTWPGHLCFTGDMGTYVFARIPDMFEFFRDKELRINPGYWSQKVLAADKHDGIERYSPEKFRTKILEQLEDYLLDTAETADEGSKLKEAVEEEVLIRADDGEHIAMSAAMGFTYDGDRIFEDFWDVSCREYSFRFLWCCHALVWGIQQYDQMKSQRRLPGEIIRDKGQHG